METLLSGLLSGPHPVLLSSYSLHECRPETGLCPTAADTRKGGKRGRREEGKKEREGIEKDGQEGRRKEGKEAKREEGRKKRKGKDGQERTGREGRASITIALQVQ